VPVLGQGTHCHRRDVTLVDQRPGRVAVRPAHDALDTDLVGPPERVGREPAGAQERPLQPRSLDEVLDLAPHPVSLRFEIILNGHRRHVDDPARMLGKNVHCLRRALGTQERPEQEQRPHPVQRSAQGLGLSQVAAHELDVVRKGSDARVAYQRPYAGPRVKQLRHDMSSDVAGGPGHQNCALPNHESHPSSCRMAAGCRPAS